MSERSEQSNWLPEDVDLLDNVDKQVQLVSTSSDSRSISNHIGESKFNYSNINLNDGCRMDETSKNIKLEGIKESNVKPHFSCDDLSMRKNDENKYDGNNDADNQNITRSMTFSNLKLEKKSGNHKYNHVESKVKQYFTNSSDLSKAKSTKQSIVISKSKGVGGKGEYLEEINKQLTKELDEKNTILLLLQENYERLLFKYAEAQNRIDELRFKCTSNNSKPTKAFQPKQNKENNTSNHFPSTDESLSNDVLETNCRRLINNSTEKYGNKNGESGISRPMSLTLDNNAKYGEKEYFIGKATTPTDSEGLSSIITSMSGHSKILNSLEEENIFNNKSNLFRCQNRNFILEANSLANDPFDKVKNWQNSLPPLEQIETPETALCNVFSQNNSESHVSNDEESPQKVGDYYQYQDESCPTSWREGSGCCPEGEVFSNRTLSLYSASHLKEKDPVDIRLSQTYNSLENSDNDKQVGKAYSNPYGADFQKNEKPLLRRSSLPAYDCDSVTSKNYRNGIYIPPLDLSNVTLSDEESYCYQSHHPSKSDGPSYKSTGNPGNISGTVQRSSTTFSFSRVPEQGPNTATTVTLGNESKSESQVYENGKCFAAECFVCAREVTRQGLCNVCGESISGKLENFYKTSGKRSNSYDSAQNDNFSSNNGSGRNDSKPFKRSVSFGSESLLKYMPQSNLHGNSLLIPSQGSLENFDLYARNLKARSQIVMKALTAHINNSNIFSRHENSKC